MPDEPIPTQDRGVKNPWIFYPILIAIFPVLSIYSANLSIIPLRMILRPVLVVVVTVAVIWFLLRVIVRDTGRAAAGTVAIAILSFAYGMFEWLLKTLIIPHEYLFAVWSVSTALITFLAIWKFRWHRMLNFLSAVLILVTVGQIGIGLFHSMKSRALSREAVGTPGQTGTDRPDIIYIILDGYGRSDALKRALGFDNRSFITGLEDRGFFVAKDSHANYCQTELSVGSSLNLDFIPSVTKLTAKDVDRDPLDEVIDHNAAAQYLRGKGYSFDVITTGFPPLLFESADVNLQTRMGMSMIEAALVQLTPFSKDSFAVITLQSQRRDSLLNAFDEISALGTKSIQPRFVVVHILAPHPPFVFGASGEPLPPKSTFGFWDGSDYMEHVSTPNMYRNGYIGQATFIGNKVLQSLDTLLSGSGQKPVVLVQGDHGSKLRLDQNSLVKTDLNECFPNLMAYYVPDSIRSNLYDGITPVNSFRLVFNGLFGEHLSPKPDQSWYSTRPLPYAFTEVTSQLADHNKMPSVPLPR